MAARKVTNPRRNPTPRNKVRKGGDGVSGPRGHASTLINPPAFSTSKQDEGTQATSSLQQDLLKVKPVAIDSAVDCLRKRLGGVRLHPHGGLISRCGAEILPHIFLHHPPSPGNLDGSCGLALLSPPLLPFLMVFTLIGAFVCFFRVFFYCL